MSRAHRAGLAAAAILLAAVSAGAQFPPPAAWRCQARLLWAPDAPRRLRVRLRLFAPPGARRLSFRLAPGFQLLALRRQGQAVPLPPPGNGLYRLQLAASPAAPSSRNPPALQLDYAGILSPSVQAGREGLVLRRRNWLPRFAPRLLFAAALRLQLPAGWKLFTRGQQVSASNDGWQNWTDSQPGYDWRIVLAPRLQSWEQQVPGAVLVSAGDAALPPAARASLRRLGRDLLAAYSSFATRYGRPRPLWMMRLWVVSAPACRAGGDAGLLWVSSACLMPPPAPPGGDPDASGAAGGDPPLAVELKLTRRLAAYWWRAPQWRRFRWLRRGGELQMALVALRRFRGRRARWQALALLQALARQARRPLLPSNPPPRLTRFQAARAALVLNALRLEIGPFLFRRLLAAAVAAPAAGAASGGPPADPPLAAPPAPRFWLARLSRFTGARWGWFWRQWLTSSRLPLIQFGWRRVRLPLSGPAVQLWVRQPRLPFTFRAPILIRTTAGRVYWQAIAVHNRSTILAVPVPGRVLQVSFDPHRELPRAAPAR